MHSGKIVIIGSGFVGTSIAYATLIRGICTELILIDVQDEKAKGEAMDLSHGLPFIRPVEIRSGSYEDCREAEVIVITAGAAQKAGESRLDLIQKNAVIMQTILKEISRYTHEAILLIVSNPVDVLTSIARRDGNFAPEHVIGSGTVLDTARFRYLLSRRFGLNPASIHGYVVGEHGDSEVPLFSSARVAGSPLQVLGDEYRLDCDADWRQALTLEVREAAYDIIKRKGSTYYGIGLAATHILQAILRDEQTVLTVSGWLEDRYGDFGVAVSVPCVVGRGGIIRRLEMLMDENEKRLFMDSIKTLRETYHGSS